MKERDRYDRHNDPEADRAETQERSDRALERADSPLTYLNIRPQATCCECGYLATEVRPGVWMCPCDLECGVTPTSIEARFRMADAIRTAMPHYDEAVFFASLRACSVELNLRGRGPSHKQYRVWAQSRAVPCAARIIQRFGRWRTAVEAAGLVSAAGTQPGHGRIYTDSDCVTAIRACADVVDRPPTYQEYVDYARRINGSVGKRSVGAPPSPRTVRNHLGRWSECLVQAFPELRTPGERSS